MPIKWKNAPNLKPAVLLERLDAARSGVGSGRVSFTGYVIDDALPALQSMLIFPDVATEVAASTLMWKAVTTVSGRLTPASFLTALNATLSSEIATRDQEFHILTSLSIRASGFRSRNVIEGAQIRILRGYYPRKYAERSDLVRTHSAEVPVPLPPEAYANVVVKVKAKSPKGAITRGLRSLDLIRAIWCLLGNADMEIVGRSWNPVNVVRLGGIHTVHSTRGDPVGEGVWCEPNFAPTSGLFSPSDSRKFHKNFDYLFRRLRQCTYNERLSDALLRYVRAFDERDQNTAFLRLWSAIEALTCPDRADYDRVITRCAFLYRDTQYHRQVLEHLREFRNQSVCGR